MSKLLRDREDRWPVADTATVPAVQLDLLRGQPAAPSYANEETVRRSK